MKKKLFNELKKVYNGSISQFISSKSSAKSIRKICGVNHLPKDITSDEIIREARKH